MGSAELVIDIGSKFTTIGQKGRGIVFREPSRVLLESKRSKMTLVDSGKGVSKYGRIKENEQIISPIRGGVIIHEYAAVLMLKDFLQRVVPRRMIFSPHIKAIACVSCGLTNTEKNQIEKILMQAGVREVVILESPIAISASIDSASSQFVVDIGATKTDIAIVGNMGIISGCSLNIGGDTFNQAIIDYITDTKRCRMTPAYAEKAKFEVGSLYENDTTCITMDLQEIGTNRIFDYKITSKDVRNAIEPLVTKIIEVLYNLSFQIPETMAQEIFLNGITLCGGSSMLPGLSEYIAMAMEMSVNIAQDPTSAVVKGGMYYLDHSEKLSSVLNVDKFI